MARYSDLLNQLLEDEVLTQEQHDELADLSAAKEAIKEFNEVKRERDELAAFKQQVETSPKRKEALKRVGVDYDAVPKYGQKALDAIPSEDLDDLEKLAGHVQAEGFEATIQAEEEGAKSGAEVITDFATSTTGTPVRTSKEASEQAFLADLDTVPDGDKQSLREVLAKHGRLVQDGDWVEASPAAKGG